MGLFGAKAPPLMRILGTLVCFALAAIASADGMYTKLDLEEQTSTLPYQRALVAYRHGQEFMVVQSVLHGPPGNYAWVIPLPNPPSRIETSEAPNFDICLFWHSPDSRPLDPMIWSAWAGGLLLVITLALMWKPSRQTSLSWLLGAARSVSSRSACDLGPRTMAIKAVAQLHPQVSLT